MSEFTDHERRLIEVWEAHTAAEFEQKDADAAIATMTDRPVLIHVPVGTGATGREAVRRFYADLLIAQTPEDFELVPLTRTVGQNRLVDEFIVRFTHSVRMDWFAPGVEPTGRKIAAPHIAVIGFEDGKISSEHIYWNHATVLRQMGILDASLPVMDAGQCDRMLNVEAPANELIARFTA